MNGPIIGIGGSLSIRKEIPYIGIEYDTNNNNYSKAIYKGGGIPIYLPVINKLEIIKRQVDMCDGIILPGGDDINPLLYGKEPLPLLGDTITKVDEYQIKLTKYALEINKPILAICKGIQTLNVAAGGTLYQDISYANPNHIKHRQDTQLYQYCHSIEINTHSKLYDLFGNKLIVNSSHHQSIKVLGKNLKITAIAPDGIVEGIEMIDKKYVVGVQWHPEMLLISSNDMLPLFKSFINCCCTCY